MSGYKEFSDIQESRIANYLGWSKVVGSGSRNFHPGDVVSDRWLGECKTHARSGYNLVFKFDVWDKISEEATSQFKYPVLFTDDGSLDIKNTYCMIQIPADLSVFADLGDLDIYDDKKSITKSLKSLLKYKSKDIPLLFIRNERLFAIMHISQFKEYICNSLDLLQ